MRNVTKIEYSAHQTTVVSVKNVAYSGTKSVEKMLGLWVDDKNQKNIPLTEAVIREKAKLIFFGFEEARKIFRNFHGNCWVVHKIQISNKYLQQKLCGEAASADILAAASYLRYFHQIVKKGDYPADLIFNFD